MEKTGRTCIEGFSLLEVVIAVVVIAMLAATSVPRMSRASKVANDPAVGADLAMLRNAIDQYCIEHGGALPAVDAIANQLTKYTDIAGAASDTKTLAHVYGPYLRNIPPLSVGPRKGGSAIAGGDADGVGWIYLEASGTIKANTTTERDDTNRLYRDY